MKQQVINGLKVIVIGLILSAGISYAGNWVAPAGPPPGNNAQGPVNVGTTGQTKAGGLGVQNFVAWDNSMFARDVYVKDIFNPGSSGDVYVHKLANNSNEHVCADAQGKLFLCGYTPPANAQCNDGIDNDGDGFTDFPNDPGCSDAWDDNESNTVPGIKQQTFTLNSSGNPVSSGDCSAPMGACDNDTFITPTNYIPGSLRIKIFGAGAGGGGGLAYQFSQGNNFSTAACQGTFNSLSPNDNGPAFAKCQINSGGGGGGGGAYSEYNSVGTQASLQYNVTVGAGGNGGTRKGYGFGMNAGGAYNLANWTNNLLTFNNPPSGYGGADGQDGGNSVVIGPLPQTNVVAQAGGGDGGKGGKIITNPHTPSSSAGTGAGGIGGANTIGANVLNGFAGSSGKYTAWPYIIDTDFSSTTLGDLIGYGSVVHSGTTSGNGGAGGVPPSEETAIGDAGTGGVGLTNCTNGGIASGGGGGGALSPLVLNSGNGCKGGPGKVIFTWQE